jgi:hypothetical protein
MPNFLCATCGSSQIKVLSPTSGLKTIQSVPFANAGQLQFANSKFAANGNMVRYGIPKPSGNRFRKFQIYSKVTSTVCQEVGSTTCGSQVNTMFVNGSGVGFGPGYGLGSETGGTNLPTNPIEVNNGAFKVTISGQAYSNGFAVCQANGVNCYTGVQGANF